MFFLKCIHGVVQQGKLFVAVFLQTGAAASLPIKHGSRSAKCSPAAARCHADTAQQTSECVRSCYFDGIALIYP